MNRGGSGTDALHVSFTGARQLADTLHVSLTSSKSLAAPTVVTAKQAYVAQTWSLVCMRACCCCYVFLPRFTATAMPGGMYDFAAVSPPSSSVVLTFGGVDSGTGRHRNGIDMYDR